jgi:hypothetical protein
MPRRRSSDMPYQHDCSDDERGMLHDLIHAFIEKLNVQRRLNEDLTRQLDAANERLAVLDARNYGRV